LRVAAGEAFSPREADMATHDLQLPHDRRTTVAALGAIVVLGAIMIFLMLMLIRNLGAY
jgi:hypothetical protein